MNVKNAGGQLLITCLRFGFITLMLSACASTRYITPEFLKDKYTDQSSQYIEVNGHAIHVRDQGSGPVIVMIHGISSSLHTWDQWCEQLKSDYRVVRLDLPGFGLSGPDPNNQYSIDRFVQVLDQVLNQLQITSFTLVGNSLGGWIAWEYCYEHPQKVEKLVLLDAAGFATPDDPPKPLRMAQKPMFKKLALKGPPKFLVRKFLKQAYGDRSKVDKELVNRYFELNHYPGNPLAFYTIANTQYTSNTARLAQIQTPTLIMWGEEDKKWIDVSHAYLFEELLPNDKLIIYQGVGHLPMEEHPLPSVVDLKEFLEQ